MMSAVSRYELQKPPPTLAIRDTKNPNPVIFLPIAVPDR